MTLPLLVSVPHAGTTVPDEVADLSRLAPEEIVADGDEQAGDLYLPLADEVQGFVTTHVARAFVDVNRAEDDRRRDGVVKTHTCWDVPIWRRPLRDDEVEALLERYHRPYHRRLSALADGGAVLGVDCHTMAAVAPPVAPDPGRERPRACVSNADGTCPAAWLDALVELLAHELGGDVRANDPFRGGHVVRSHAPELPWLQLELNRGPFLPVEEKRAAVHAALRALARELPAARRGSR